MTAPPPPPPRVRPGLLTTLLVGLIPLMFTAGGFFLVFSAGPRLIESLLAKNWPAAAGRLISKDIVEVDYDSNGPNTKRWFEVHVVYEYEAAGRRHRGTRIGVWNDGYQFPKATEVGNAYYPGQDLTVYYNPSDPARSLLVREVGAGTWFMVCLGIPLSILGVAMGGRLRPCRAPRPGRFLVEHLRIGSTGLSTAAQSTRPPAMLSNTPSRRTHA